ncbi:potassium channel family protein [Geodermatophilus sp. SYSU D00710]
MGEVLGWSVTAVGALLVLVALRDIFHTIWHPSGRGWLSRRLLRGVWWAGRGRVGPVTGPLAMTAVILTWMLLIAGGWALVYWPHLPDGFAFATGLDPSARAGLLDALYLSAVTLTTLGFGDISPEVAWLRLVVPVEALVGLTLVTAAVSWVLQVYPALSRRRALAIRLTLLQRSGAGDRVAAGDSALAPALLAQVAADVVQQRVDLFQHPETHWFTDSRPDAALAPALDVALDLAAAAMAAADPDTRFAGRLLEAAVHDFLVVVDDEFLHTRASPRDVLDRYADARGVRRLPAG